MMQMNVLVSSNNQQYMMTYTDMASRFLPESPEMALAWQSIMSLDLSDSAPSRFTKPLFFGAVAALILGLLVMFKITRRRRFSGLYSDVDSGEVSLSSPALSEMVSETDLVPSKEMKSKKVKKNQSRSVSEFDPISFENSEAVSELPIKKLAKAKDYSSEDLSMEDQKEESKNVAVVVSVSHHSSKKDTPKKASKEKSEPSFFEDFSMAGYDASWTMNVSNQ
jgi:hypothetical protein